MPSLSFDPERRRLLVAAATLPFCVEAEARVARLDRSASIANERALAPQLAAVYAGQVDPALCFVSEKYDGVRAVWDGRVLRHRSGRPVSAPAAFVAALPATPLDGELWLGRRRFDAVSALVRRATPIAAEWAGVRYMVFDTPLADLPFSARLERLAALAPHLPAAVELAPQARGSDRAELQRRLDRVIAGGGEGLMLHVASAQYVPGRSESLLKLKPYRDAEAVVVGHRAGAGKYRTMVGALEVRVARGAALLHRQRSGRCGTARAAGDRHRRHLPLSRPHLERAAALRDLPAAASRRLICASRPSSKPCAAP